MATPPNDPSQLHLLSGFITALQEQDKLLTEAMRGNKPELSVPHVAFIKRIFDKVGAFDPNLVGPFAAHADPVTSLAQIRDAIAKLNARVELLRGDDSSRLRKRRANLTSLLSQFQQQDEILKGLIPRSASWQGAPDSVMNVLQELFANAAAALPEKAIRFENNNDLDGLRAQITSARSKLEAGLSDVESSLDEYSPPMPASTTAVPKHAANPRCVFVVHGRNEAANNALSSFLRSIGLDPMEWEEAIALTGHGTPYPGEALEVAFSRAQAAVVLLTGDDMARLGARFLKPSDKEYERDLTPQCRPNVLFEAGMAFGKHPERTIVVALGETRPFSDILGRHIVHLSNSPQSRLRLISRLRTARCDVQYETREQWLTEGDFDTAKSHPDLPNGPSPAQADAGSTPQTRVPISELYYPRLSDEVRESARVGGGEQPNPLLADGSTEHKIASPDDFIVRIVCEGVNTTKGLTLNVINDRLSAIGKTRLIIRSAQSFDSRKNGYRDGRAFRPFDHTEPDPIDAGYSGKAVWLVHKRSSHPHLFAGNDDQHPLFWPDNDKSTIQRWLVSFEVLAFTLPAQQGDPDIPLKSVKQTISLAWNPSKNEFFIDKAPEQQ